MNSNAKALIIKDSSKEYKCNICDDTILNDTIIGLHCDPYKHIFCYQCILDWYTVLKKKTHYANYQMVTMCPICKQNGGKIPICNDVTPIKGIHTMKPIKPFIICGASLKSNPSKKCSARGNDKYGGKCHYHKNIDNPVLISTDSVNENVKTKEVSNSENTKVEKNIEKHVCYAPLKTRKGQFCMSVGSHKYAGRCGKHKNIPPNADDDTVTVTVI